MSWPFIVIFNKQNYIYLFKMLIIISTKSIYCKDRRFNLSNGIVPSRLSSSPKLAHLFIKVEMANNNVQRTWNLQLSQQQLHVKCKNSIQKGCENIYFFMDCLPSGFDSNPSKPTGKWLNFVVTRVCTQARQLQQWSSRWHQGDIHVERRRYFIVLAHRWKDFVAS